MLELRLNEEDAPMETRISAFDLLARNSALDAQADDKRKIKKNSSQRILSLVELESEILAMRTKLASDASSALTGMGTLVQNKKLFQRSAGAWPLLQFYWPYDGEIKTIKVRAYSRTQSSGAASGVYTLDFRIGRQQLMTITTRGEHIMKVGLPDPRLGVEWPLTAIHEVVDVFNMLLQAHRIYYGDLGAINVGTGNLQGIKYSGEDFERYMTKYSKYNLTCRLNNSIVAYIPEQANTYQFNMDWFDKENYKHRLKVSFTRGEKFSDNLSRFLTEKNLLNLVPSYHDNDVKPGQLYYSLKINQMVRQPDTWSSSNIRRENYSEYTILSMWFTLDGLIGELRNINSGDQLSGNDVLQIYQHFATLLKIENVFICDDSTLEDTAKHVKIPLRVIAAIATGKTWFEKMPGVRLFESKSLPVGSHDVVKQSSFTRDAALRELQGLPLVKWYHMLDQERKRTLYVLHQYYWPRKQRSGLFNRGSNTGDINPSHFGEMTLKTLAEKIYKESKKTGQCTLELSKLNDLLCSTVGLAIDSLSWIAKAPDQWVKVRVHQLMWGSYIWHQKGSQQESAPNVQQLLH